MIRILTVNTGSTSLKLERYDLESDPPAIAAPLAPAASYEATIDGAERVLADATASCDFVAHRIVRMPDGAGAVVPLDSAMLEQIRSLEGEAPLHNATALRMTQIVANLTPKLQQFAISDSAFHTTMSVAAVTYALPRAIAQRYGIRRIGYHGLSHEYAAHRACADNGIDVANARVVTAHLGGGSSLCAVRGGKSIDTTMGFTPLEGVPMATRSGSIDPGVLLHLIRNGVAVDELARLLEHESGMLGISGTSGDVRELLANSQSAEATLALAVFAWRVRAALGALIATLGGVDAIVFTGGIGEHAHELRAKILEGGLGIEASEDATSRVHVCVVQAREGWVMARKLAAHLCETPMNAIG